MQFTIDRPLLPQLRQWAALIIYEHTEDREQVWIKRHQTGMVGHQQRTRVYVESDVRGIGPGKWIQRAARVGSRSRVTHFFSSIRPQHRDLTGARQSHVKFARLAKGDSIRPGEDERRKELIAMKL